MSPPSAPCGVCQCTFGSSDCFHWIGGLDGEPYAVEAILDEDEGNLLECGPAGLSAFLPAYLLDPPAVSAYASVDQVIPRNAGQLLFFNLEHFDTDSMHDKTDDQVSTRLTINTPGIYLVSLDIRWDKTNDGDRLAGIRKNGTDFIAYDALHSGDADLYVSQSVMCQENFEAGEYVEAYVRQDSGTSNEEDALLLTSTRWSPIFSATFLRPPPE